jgi:hypothetical protein
MYYTVHHNWEWIINEVFDHFDSDFSEFCHNTLMTQANFRREHYSNHSCEYCSKTPPESISIPRQYLKRQKDLPSEKIRKLKARANYALFRIEVVKLTCKRASFETLSPFQSDMILSMNGLWCDEKVFECLDPKDNLFRSVYRLRCRSGSFWLSFTSFFLVGLVLILVSRYLKQNDADVTMPPTTLVAWDINSKVCFLVALMISFIHSLNVS